MGCPPQGSCLLCKAMTCPPLSPSAHVRELLCILEGTPVGHTGPAVTGHHLTIATPRGRRAGLGGGPDSSCTAKTEENLR